MKLEIIQIVNSMHRAYFRQNLKYDSVELFKNNFISLFEKIDANESEEHNKNIVANFLRDTYYKNKYEINTAGRKDLVIHKGKSNKTPVAVILEIKKPSNKQEMISEIRPNTKALHETIHYYLKERLNGNTEIKHIIISNIYEWFIFDAQEFEKYFYLNKTFKTQYQNWTQGKLAGKTTDWFYKEIAKPFVEENIDNLSCNYVNLHDYSNIASHAIEANDSKLINLYKIFSPEYLLKLPFSNDYNKIDTGFYHELLYIFGLEEVESGGTKIITRVKAKDRQAGSILEDIINTLIVKKKFKNVSDLAFFGENEEEQLFSIALELAITWLNRVLFLKLLEGQLIRYHKDNQDFAFINSKKIKYFEELDELFFEVLAIKPENRSQSVNERFGNLPYLNSSLFEQTKLEKQTIQLADLKNRITIPIYQESVLKQKSLPKNTQNPNTLAYFLDFLTAYNFASDPKAEIQNDTRTLINSAVLGLIFEKINGYKEGSFYTPSFITKHMSSETLKKIVVEKFSKSYDKEFQNFEQVKGFIDYTNEKERQKANQIINSIKICDPAVGSGHFLVSILNELIAIKSDLRILEDVDKNRIRGIKINNVNDELEIINYETSEPFQYFLNKKGLPHPEIQNLQKALFYEKQTLIESCIFGVDINQKSVSICRLRLWIELLKNTFYTQESNYTFLETLPNIDINIKQGNSLISFFDLNGNGLKNGRFQKLHKFTKEYKIQVDLYKNVKDADAKERILDKIEAVKEAFLDFVNPRDKDFVELKKKEAKLTEQFIFFSREEQEEWKINHAKLKAEVAQEKNRLEEKKRTIYKHAFEWRFEFPEVLSDTGEFEGFDMVVGNPPYFSISKQQELKEVKNNYQSYKQTGDVYMLFIERGLQIVKKDGIVNLITSNKWMRSAFGENLRAFLLENTKILQLIDFDGLKVFDAATVDTSIIELKKQKGDTKSIETVRFDKTFNLEKGSISKYYQNNKKTLSNLSSSAWNLISEKEKLIKIQIEKIGKAISEWNVEINRGILTGLNEAFIIDEKTKEKLIKKDSKNKTIIKPLITGREINKFFVQNKNNWIIFIPWHFPIHQNKGIKGSSPKAEKEFIKQYPKLYRYFKTHQKKLMNRNSSETGKRYEWYALQRCAATYHQDFEKEKIMWQAITKKFDFYYDTKSMYSDVTTFIMTGENLKYILSILNSRLFDFAMNEIYLLGDTFRSKNKILQNFPIPEITSQNKATITKIEKLVNTILTKKETANESVISEEQTKIDKLIYQLYDLTEEQIRIIEKK